MTARSSDPTLDTRGSATTIDDDDDGSGPRASVPGARIGRYTIVRLLGRGGMGSVYEADDPELDRRVALKVLREDRDADTEGLRREAQALARLVHQNVVMVYDVGVSNGEVFLVMQLVEGQTIDAWLGQRSVEPAQIIAMFRQAGEGLVAAHAAGLVHCDFKPGNVLVDTRGIVRVSDFGLARATRSISLAPGAAIAPMIGTTTVAGTPAYMAPEQLAGVVTAASDQFAFSVALWECLAGERPFADSTLARSNVHDASTRGVHERGPRRPLRRGVKLPKHVVVALERGMAPDPAGRFPSMAALLAALEPRRSLARVAAIAGSGGLVAGGLVAYALFGRASEEPWDGADTARRRPLTSYGDRACAYSPAFEPGGKTVVFDRTAADTVDLYAVPLAGGEPEQLTSAPTWEWRASPGRRPGEVVHLIHDQSDPSKSLIAYLDLATRRATPVVRALAWDAGLGGDTLYYSPDAMAGIRALRGKEDRAFVQPDASQQFMLLAASPAGDRVAVTRLSPNDGPTRACLVDTETSRIECLPRPTPARPAFGAGGRALYLATYDGIVRRDLATGEEKMVVRGVYAEGGLAIPPDGDALVYSTCYTHAKLVDVTSGETLVDDEAVVYATVSSEGLLAWARELRGTRVLIARLADGREVQLTLDEHGNAGNPRFSPDGKSLVFGTSEPRPGLHIVDVERAGGVRQVTSNARDKNPIWTSTGVIAYTRGDRDGNEHVFAVTPDGGAPTQLAPSTRTAYGSRGGELLVGGVDAMYWLDAATGAERPGPPKPPGMLISASTSPSGAWVVYQVGPMGQELWRIRADGAGELERVASYAAGDNVAMPAIRDDGHVLAVVGRWYGDLVAIPARPGSRF